MTYEFINENGLGEVEISLGGVKKTVTIQCDERGRLRLLEPIMVSFPHGKQLHEVSFPDVIYKGGRLRFTAQMVYSLGRNYGTPVEWANKSKERTAVFVYTYLFQGRTRLSSVRFWAGKPIEEARELAAAEVQDMELRGDKDISYIEIS